MTHRESIRVPRECRHRMSLREGLAGQAPWAVRPEHDDLQGAPSSPIRLLPVSRAARFTVSGEDRASPSVSPEPRRGIGLATPRGGPCTPASLAGGHAAAVTDRGKRCGYPSGERRGAEHGRRSSPTAQAIAVLGTPARSNWMAWSRRNASASSRQPVPSRSSRRCSVRELIPRPRATAGRTSSDRRGGSQDFGGTGLPTAAWSPVSRSQPVHADARPRQAAGFGEGSGQDQARHSD